MRKRLVFLAPLAILGIAVFILIGGEVVRLLWNWIAPAVFGLREITFWQAIGLLALCRILFGGLGGRMSSRSHARQRIRERIAERCEQMSPEERERLRQGLYGRWGGGAPPESKPTPEGSGGQG